MIGVMINISLIINLTISITISLVFVFIFYKILSDTLSAILNPISKNILSRLAQKFYPPKFTVNFVDNDDSAIIDFGKLTQDSLPAAGENIYIKFENIFYKFYEQAKPIIQLRTARPEIVGIYHPSKVTGKNGYYNYGEYNTKKYSFAYANFRLDFKPTSTFENEEIEVLIFFHGKVYTKKLYLSVRAELTIPKQN